MKITVSIPDDLWQAALGASNDSSPSVIVQQALRSWVHRQQVTSTYRRTPELDDELKAKRQQAASRIGQMLQNQYANGYAQGIELAGQLEPEQLVYVTDGGVLAAAHMARDIEERLATAEAGTKLEPPLPEGATLHVPGRLLEPYLGAHAAFVMESEWTPAPATVEGIDQALRDIREMGEAL